jgi:hypothetical protein
VTDTFIEDQLEAPDDFGQGEQEVEGQEQSYDFTELDLDEFRHHQVRIKVDGEEVVVPLTEAVAGYQRQADYTRKTQELAQQRSELNWATALKGALDNDPQGTVDLLMQHYGLSRPQAQAAQQQMAADPYGFDDFDLDPRGGTQQDPRLSEIEQRLARFEQAQAQQQLQVEIARLQTTYGPDFDPNEVIAAALKNRSTDLEATFKQVAFDRLLARQRQGATDAARTQTKKSAAVVSGGASAKPTGRDDGPIRTIADAFRAAKRELES